MIEWHTTPVVRRILRGLGSSNCMPVRCTAIPRDFFVWAGRTPEADRILIALDVIRRASIEKELGFAFSDADNRIEAEEYIRLDGETPSVYTVVLQHFEESMRRGG